MPGNSINNTTMWTPGGGWGGPAQQQNLSMSASPYESNPYTTYNSPRNDGTQDTSPNNPTQFATAPTASRIAQQQGGSVTNATMGGGNETSVPQRQISFGQNQDGMNAGLANDMGEKYGTSPGSYGAFLLARDKASQMGQSYIDPYANGTAAQRNSPIGVTPQNAGQSPIRFPGYSGAPSGGPASTGGATTPTSPTTPTTGYKPPTPRPDPVNPPATTFTPPDQPVKFNMFPLKRKIGNPAFATA